MAGKNAVCSLYKQRSSREKRPPRGLLGKTKFRGLRLSYFSAPSRDRSLSGARSDDGKPGPGNSASLVALSCLCPLLSHTPPPPGQVTRRSTRNESARREQEALVKLNRKCLPLSRRKWMPNPRPPAFSQISRTLILAVSLAGTLPPPDNARLIYPRPLLSLSLI